MSTNQEWFKRLQECVPSGIGIGNQVFIKEAKNAELWDIEGRRYIDFGGGIGVINSGHCHPKIVERVKQQIDSFTHVCFQVTPYTSYVELAEKLNKLTPGDFAKKTMLVSTGAEAVENSIKIARMATKRRLVIAFGGGFHGRSLFASSLTGKVNPYKMNLGLVTSDVFHVPFPGGLDGSLDKTREAIEELFKSDIEPQHVAAIIFEPVQGEGGFNKIHPDAAQWLRQLCDEHGIVLIADEVQSGFARTGKMLAMQHYSVIPDITLMAKSLAGGFTLGAVTGKKEIMDGPVKGALGGTYAGNPAAIAAALATLEIMEEEDLPGKAEIIGQKTEAVVKKHMDKLKSIREFRRLGAMAAIEFIDPTTHKPSAELAQKVQKSAFEQGLLLLTCGRNGNVIRFLTPLTIEDNIMDEALQILDKALLSIA